MTTTPRTGGRRVALVGSGLRAARLAAAGLEGFKVGALDDVDRADLAGRQTASLDVPPDGDVRQAQLARRFRQDHLFLVSHADRIGAAVMTITRKTLYISLLFPVEYVTRLTDKGVMPALLFRRAVPPAAWPLSIVGRF